MADLLPVEDFLDKDGKNDGDNEDDEGKKEELNVVVDNDSTGDYEEDEDDEDEDDEDVEDEDYIKSIANKHKSSSKSDPSILFTNSLGFSADNKSQLSSVIESESSKKEFSLVFQPDPSLYCLVYRWARRPAYTFAADVLNSNLVVASEVGFSSPFDLCNLRGWILTRRAVSTNRFYIEYKKFHECLLKAKIPPGHKALNLKGIVQMVYEPFGYLCSALCIALGSACNQDS
jgi:hypothetical protein